MTQTAQPLKGRAGANDTGKAGDVGDTGKAGEAGDIWVFAYGSLMWDAGFPYLEAAPALLDGYHRALCIYSRFYRGTPERPGLVLGLDLGGSCRGMAFRVAAQKAGAVLDYLDERELLSYAYRRRRLMVDMTGSEGSAPVPAYVYVADPEHSQYAGELAPEAAVDLIVQGVGVGGSSVDYLDNTVRHLKLLGIPDGPLHALLARVVERLRHTLAFEV